MNARLIVAPPDAASFEHPLAGDVIIGRAASANLVVPDASVSRHHARVFEKDGAWWAEDLGARNGTLLNGQPLVGASPLADGDTLALGGTTIGFSAATVALPVEALQPGTGGRPASLVTALGEPPDLRSADRQAARLNTINEVHRALARPISLKDLLDLILDRCFEVLRPEEGVILLRGADGQWAPAATKQAGSVRGEMLVSKSLSDEVAGRGRPALVLDAAMDERFAGAHSIMVSGVRSMVAAPLADADGSLGMVALASRVGVRQFSQEDLDMLVSIASVAALRVRNVALADEAAARRVLERELSLAHDMQMAMLPRRLPTDPSMELATHLWPARSVGGDLYDFFEDGPRLWFIVADVSGKGVAAALVTAVVKTLFRAIAPGEPDVSRVLARMNDELCRDNDQMLFVTAALGCLDRQTGVVTIGDVGHNPAFVIGAGGALGAPPVPKNVAFGVVPSAPFEAGRIALAPGETLVLYTDGVTDARSAAGEIYGSARLEAVLRGVGAAPPAAVLEAMQRSVEAFAAGAAQEDDITILVLRRR